MQPSLRIVRNPEPINIDDEMMRALASTLGKCADLELDVSRCVKTAKVLSGEIASASAEDLMMSLSELTDVLEDHKQMVKGQRSVPRRRTLLAVASVLALAGISLSNSCSCAVKDINREKPSIRRDSLDFDSGEYL